MALGLPEQAPSSTRSRLCANIRVDSPGVGIVELVEGPAQGLVVEPLRFDALPEKNLDILQGKDLGHPEEGSAVLHEGSHQSQEPLAGAQLALRGVPLKKLVDGLDKLQTFQKVADDDAHPGLHGLGAGTRRLLQKVPKASHTKRFATSRLSPASEIKIFQPSGWRISGDGIGLGRSDGTDVKSHKGTTLMLVWQEYKAVHIDGYVRFCQLYGEW